LVLRWNSPSHPLPMRVIRAPRRRGASAGHSRFGAFDFCAHMRQLCADIAERSPEFGHIDVSRILFAVAQARTGRRHGLQARVTPLRFRKGALTRRSGGREYQVQRYVVNNRDMLYLVSFCLPRFLDLDFEEKLVTVFHELYHISPAFDGDLRRHRGRYRLHSHSQRCYDAHMLELARAYLNAGATPELHAFLRSSFAQLQAQHGSIVGIVVPRAKVVPVMIDQGQVARSV
jgi:Putative phage metallopeptidase